MESHCRDGSVSGTLLRAFSCQASSRHLLVGALAARIACPLCVGEQWHREQDNQDSFLTLHLSNGTAATPHFLASPLPVTFKPPLLISCIHLYGFCRTLSSLCPESHIENNTSSLEPHIQACSSFGRTNSLAVRQKPMFLFQK